MRLEGDVNQISLPKTNGGVHPGMEGQLAQRDSVIYESSQKGDMIYLSHPPGGEPFRWMG